MTESDKKKILLAHGGGGQLTDELIRETILKKLGAGADAKLYDSAVVGMGAEEIVFTTDSYVVKPLFFNGGDIGKLAVCGTVNDLAVCGAKPIALSLAFIIEAGLEFGIFERVLDSIKQAADENYVRIVTGDTKTVEAGSADKLFINTAGVGVRIGGADVGFDKIRAGDKVIISGTIGDHGMTIISQREGIKFESELKSDCAGLCKLTCKLFEEVSGIKFMRDPTRGGLAASLNEICRETGLGIEIGQDDIPVDSTVQAAANMLGFDVLNIANEGKIVAIVAEESAEAFVDICKANPLGREASIIGEVVEAEEAAVVEMITNIGGRRIVQIPYGRELPRIC